jgi:hypothetical protein
MTSVRLGHYLPASRHPRRRHSASPEAVTREVESMSEDAVEPGVNLVPDRRGERGHDEPLVRRRAPKASARARSGYEQPGVATGVHFGGLG